MKKYWIIVASLLCAGCIQLPTHPHYDRPTVEDYAARSACIHREMITRIANQGATIAQIHGYTISVAAICNDVIEQKLSMSPTQESVNDIHISRQQAENDAFAEGLSIKELLEKASK